MPQAYSHLYSSSLRAQRPSCPKCHGRMVLARIDASVARSDLWTFECGKCENIQKMLVEDTRQSIKT